jgi:AcrR family transcriptional regulator
MPPQAQVKYNTPLRQAQRELTRSRIKNAARNLFYETHYDTTTMDEIAVAAGLRRSTLYLHYKDKSEILLDVIAEYTPRAKEVLASLPGPQPSLDELLRWVKRVAKFVAREHSPLSIIMEYRSRHKDAAELETMTTELLAAMGANNQPFRDASAPNADPQLQARALMLLQELTYACSFYLEDPKAARGKAILEIAAFDFMTFLSKPATTVSPRKKAAPPKTIS